MVAGGGEVVGGCGDSGGGGVEVVVANGIHVGMEIVVVKGCGEMGNMRARWKSTYVATYWE